ncbi:MAG: NAD-binding protein, partial [Planctomycetes bacterium]|nr:NAD-binding protein [Planctomycetota bacterium]
MRAEDISEVAVIGAGTMGAGIAGEFARAGCRVRLMDLSEDVLARGMATLDSAQKALVGAKLITASRAKTARKRVTPMTCLETSCDGVQLLVEAVSEDMALKKKLFR